MELEKISVEVERLKKYRQQQIDIFDKKITNLQFQKEVILTDLELTIYNKEQIKKELLNERNKLNYRFPLLSSEEEQYNAFIDYFIIFLTI